MLKTTVTYLFCTFVLLVSGGTQAQVAPPSTRELLHRFGAAPNGLARYNYLVSVLPTLPEERKSLAQQLLATVDSELGLYNEAVMAFPFDNRNAPPRELPLPTPEHWRSENAVDAVAEQAASRHIVMINEAHHDAHTRELTLALLPRLRALGFRYFAVEALGDQDTALSKRGYPTDQSGTEYLMEPLYGEIIRQAIKLGYTLVPYDTQTTSLANREADEAATLYAKVFAADPDAKLFVHAGYSHIDKAPGNLGKDIQPMAAELKQLSGYDPLCVDQVQFRDVAVGGLDFGFYSTVAGRFKSTVPIALRNLQTHAVWSSDPRQRDISVILPPAAERDLDVSRIKKPDSRGVIYLMPPTPFDVTQRPDWLSLGQQRLQFPISQDLCNDQLPCVIEAHYPSEPDAAVPADRYTFTIAHAHNVLYLFPGRYRLRAWNADGTTLAQQDVQVR